MKGGPATTTLHYTRPDGATFYEFNKEIGSDITGLEMGRRELALLMEAETKVKFLEVV